MSLEPNLPPEDLTQDVLNPLAQVEKLAVQSSDILNNLIQQREQIQGQIDIVAAERRSFIDTLVAHKPGYVDPDAKPV